MEIAKGRIAYTLLSIAVSGAVAYWVAPRLVLASGVAGFVGTVVAVMTGLTISLIFYVGDPSALSMTGKWKIMQLYRDTFKGTIVRRMCVVAIQVTALFATLAYLILNHVKMVEAGGMAAYGYLFLSVWSILLTVPLFFGLYRSHMERYDAIIRELKTRNEKD